LWTRIKTLQKPEQRSRKGNKGKRQRRELCLQKVLPSQEPSPPSPGRTAVNLRKTKPFKTRLFRTKLLRTKLFRISKGRASPLGVARLKTKLRKKLPHRENQKQNKPQLRQTARRQQSFLPLPARANLHLRSGVHPGREAEASGWCC